MTALGTSPPDSVQVRQAEEARAREKARREAEAKKKAKTRVLMSSLFDKASSEVGDQFCVFCL